MNLCTFPIWAIFLCAMLVGSVCVFIGTIGYAIQNRVTKK